MVSKVDGITNECMWGMWQLRGRILEQKLKRNRIISFEDCEMLAIYCWCVVPLHSRSHRILISMAVQIKSIS